MKGPRYNFVSILGYGDALISLWLLERALPFPGGIRILGTAVTQEVQNAIFRKRIEIIKILPDHAAFLRVRYAGIWQSYIELTNASTWVRNNLDEENIVIFEKRDIRNRLMLGRCSAGIIQPDKGSSTYQDRKEMLENIVGKKIELPQCVALKEKPRSILVNPSARAEHREIKQDVMEALISVLSHHGIDLSVLDPDGRYYAQRNKFTEYFGSTDLASAANLVRNHDCYIGPDSLFIHLAYYLRKPFVTLVPYADFDFKFSPPGSDRNVVSLVDARDPLKLESQLGALLVW